MPSWLPSENKVIQIEKTIVQKWKENRAHDESASEQGTAESPKACNGAFDSCKWVAMVEQSMEKWKRKARSIHSFTYQKNISLKLCRITRAYKSKTIKR